MISGSTGPRAAAGGGLTGSAGSCMIGVRSGLSSEFPLADCIPAAVSGLDNSCGYGSDNSCGYGSCVNISCLRLQTEFPLPHSDSVASRTT